MGGKKVEANLFVTSDEGTLSAGLPQCHASATKYSPNFTPEGFSKPQSGNIEVLYHLKHRCYGPI